MSQLNVFGEPLPICCEDPMTGFTRSGSCETMDQDHGIHTVCAHMTDEFLAFSKAQGNDLSTPMPEYGFPGLKEGDVKDLVALASFLRNAFFKEELGQLYSLRTAINTLENLQLYNSMEQAFKLSFYNRLNEFEQTIASELYQRVFAKELCKI